MVVNICLLSKWFYKPLIKCFSDIMRDIQFLKAGLIQIIYNLELKFVIKVCGSSYSVPARASEITGISNIKFLNHQMEPYASKF